MPRYVTLCLVVFWCVADHTLWRSYTGGARSRRVCVVFNKSRLLCCRPHAVPVVPASGEPVGIRWLLARRQGVPAGVSRGRVVLAAAVPRGVGLLLVRDAAGPPGASLGRQGRPPQLHAARQDAPRLRAPRRAPRLAGLAPTEEGLRPKGELPLQEQPPQDLPRRVPPRSARSR